MSERTDRHINNMEAAHTSSFSTGAAAASTLPAARVTVYREAGSSDVSTSALSIFQAASPSVRLSLACFDLVAILQFKVTQMMIPKIMGLRGRGNFRPEPTMQ